MEQEKTQEPLRVGFTNEWENTFNMLDILKDVFVFVLVAGLAFGWVFLMLLIISFVTLSLLHFEIEVMLIISIVCGAAAGIAHIIKTVLKYRGMSFRHQARLIKKREENAPKEK